MSHAAGAGGNYELWATRASRPAAVETKTRASAAMLREEHGRTDRRKAGRRRGRREQEKREVAERKRNYTERLANATGNKIATEKQSVRHDAQPYENFWPRTLMARVGPGTRSRERQRERPTIHCNPQTTTKTTKSTIRWYSPPS